MTASDLDLVARTLDSLNRRPGANHRTGVVVAEADPAERLQVACHLENRGYETWIAGSAIGVVQVCLEHPGDIDLLVCDDELNDLPAPDLYDWLRTRIPGLLCCVLARAPDGEAAASAARMGAKVVEIGGPAPPAGEVRWSAR